MDRTLIMASVFTSAAGHALRGGGGEGRELSHIKVFDNMNVNDIPSDPFKVSDQLLDFHT